MLCSFLSEESDETDYEIQRKKRKVNESEIFCCFNFIYFKFLLFYFFDPISGSKTKILKDIRFHLLNQFKICKFHYKYVTFICCALGQRLEYWPYAHKNFLYYFCTRTWEENQSEHCI